MGYINKPTIERSIEEIFITTCEYFDVDLDKVRSKGQQRELVNARSIASYISFAYYNHNQTKIAEFAKRERTFVSHCKDTVEDLMSVEIYSTKIDVKNILSRLKFTQDQYDYRAEIASLRINIYNVNKNLRELRLELRLKQKKVRKYSYQ